MPQACYRFKVGLTVFCAVFLVALSAHSGDRGPGPFGKGEWPSYGADTANSKYAPLDQIHKDNVKDLQIAWRWSSVENAILKDHPELWTMVNEATPLMLDGRLYTSTSLSQIAAIDARTGQTLWVYDPESYKQDHPPISGSYTAGSPIGLTGRRSAFLLVRGMRSSLPSTPKRVNRSQHSARMAASI